MVLIPTAGERAGVSPIASRTLESTGTVVVELCGFGPIAAAANTARLLQLHQPAKTMLIGIAGTFSDKVPIGQALSFSNVACYGVGVGSGTRFISGHKLGFPQIPDKDITSCDQFAEELSLESESTGRRLLVSVCAASANEVECNERLSVLPDAIAEDMEGFGVALACYQNGTPLSIVRGISNYVGDRNRENWRIELALEAARELAIRMISNSLRRV
jgi:futalosine hydrolase